MRETTEICSSGRRDELIAHDWKVGVSDLGHTSSCEGARVDSRRIRSLGTFVKSQEVQYHHDVYNQYLWNMF